MSSQLSFRQTCKEHTARTEKGCGVPQELTLCLLTWVLSSPRWGVVRAGRIWNRRRRRSRLFHRCADVDRPPVLRKNLVVARQTGEVWKFTDSQIDFSCLAEE